MRAGKPPLLGKRTDTCNKAGQHHGLSESALLVEALTKLGRQPSMYWKSCLLMDDISLRLGQSEKSSAPAQEVQPGKPVACNSRRLCMNCGLLFWGIGAHAFGQLGFPGSQ